MRTRNEEQQYKEIFIKTWYKDKYQISNIKENIIGHFLKLKLFCTFIWVHVKHWVKSKFVLNLKINSIAQLAYLEGILLYMDGAFCTNSLCTCKVDLWGKDTLVDFGNVTFI